MHITAMMLPLNMGGGLRVLNLGGLLNRRRRMSGNLRATRGSDVYVLCGRAALPQERSTYKMNKFQISDFNPYFLVNNF